jgi:hypothetical protein
MKLWESCLCLTLNLCCWAVVFSKEVEVVYERGFLFKYFTLNYSDDDLATSISLGSKCEQFIIKESSTFGVDPLAEAETRPHAVEICQQVVAVSCILRFIMNYHATQRNIHCANIFSLLEFIPNLLHVCIVEER